MEHLAAPARTALRNQAASVRKLRMIRYNFSWYNFLKRCCKYKEFTIFQIKTKTYFINEMLFVQNNGKYRTFSGNTFTEDFAIQLFNKALYYRKANTR